MSTERGSQKTGVLSLLKYSPSMLSETPQKAAKKEVHQYLSLDACASDNPSV